MLLLIGIMKAEGHLRVRWTMVVVLMAGIASFPVVQTADLNSTVDNQLNTSPAPVTVHNDVTTEPDSYLSHEFGYAVIPREHPDSWQDAMYILHPDDPLPHDGYVTEWNMYANYSANLTLAIFRHDEHNSIVGSHLLIGFNNVTVTGPGVHKFHISPEHQIRFKEGDLIGIYFEGTNPIPFTKGLDSGCKTGTMYIQQPCDFNVCHTYVFRQKQDGWNPCRIYSISAHIVNESSQIGRQMTKSPLDEGQTENSSQHEAVIIEPDSFEVKVFHGRSANEGLVMVRPPRGQWGTVCDDGWDDADATVVCRELGFRAGYARFYPYFGKTNASLPIYIDDMQCVGTEPTLSSCQRQTGWRQHNCQHEEDAGVQCIVNQADEKQHYFGYPAVPRSQIDRWQRGVYIPHPHQQLPWRKGTINSWHFFLQGDPGSKISITLQVWRLKGQLAYMLVGQTMLTKLDQGFHEKYLTGREVIDFEAGDVIGLQFDSINPVPYDLRHKSCSSDERVLYLVHKDMHNNPTLHEGAVYAFQEKPDTWKACRMYSLFAQYTGEASQGNFVFHWWHSRYRVIVNKVDTAFGAIHRCQQELGSTATLARITHEDELLMITRALTSLQLDFNRAMWVAGSPRDSGLITKWGECEPARGKECIVLKKQFAAETYSTDEYYMYAENCHQAHYFVCELEHEARENPNDTPDSKISMQSKERPLSPFTTLSPVTVIRSPSRDLHRGVVAAVVMVTLTSVVILSFVGLFLYRRRKRRQFCPNENDESTVRFVTLHDKAPI